ncbi:EpsG family protein [Chryseobacterium chendengshani]|uniref:EpsG family protein n=1 Tax=Chryseobacterium sp. LJ756 TaxID=2864113 RepID=UPI001C642797|nr:EpsG family protein [Chryseobacterium sp. LJ756]MBW7676638.1 EpsG family protein [Chryseobacterium sp. LJ756]
MNPLDIFNLKYFVIYSVFAFAAVIFAMYIDIKKKQYNNISIFLTSLFFLLVIFHFGFRDLEIGSDTEMYKWMFLTYSNTDFGIQLIFKYLIIIVHVFTNNHQYFLLIISFLYISVIFWSITIYLQSFKSNFLLIGFAFISLFFFRQLGINIIRQGVSLAFVLLAVNYYIKNNKNIKSWALPFIIAVGFHSATVIIFLIFIFIVLVKKATLKFYYCWYIILLIISAFGGSILSLGQFLNYFLVVDSNRTNYYIKGEGAGEYVVGFKAQFAAFNTIFLLIFSFINYRVLKNEDENYKMLLKYYMAISGLFFMMFQIPFSDRWGVMTWAIIPFLVAPLFTVRKNERYALSTVLFFIFIFVFFNIYNNS